MINVHVACDDAVYRNVIADFLGHQTGMEVVGSSGDDELGAATIALAHPDVVVLSAQPTTGAAEQVRQIVESERDGAPIVAYCRSPEQARVFQRFGIDRLVFSFEPARQLTEAVRAAYDERTRH